MQFYFAYSQKNQLPCSPMHYLALEQVRFIHSLTDCFSFFFSTTESDLTLPCGFVSLRTVCVGMCVCACVAFTCDWSADEKCTWTTQLYLNSVILFHQRNKGLCQFNARALGTYNSRLLFCKTGAGSQCWRAVTLSSCLYSVALLSTECCSREEECRSRPHFLWGLLQNEVCTFSLLSIS